MFSPIWFLVPFVISALSTLLIERVCIKLGVLDLPGERKMQKTPIPRMGGLAIFLTSTVFALIYSLPVPGFLFWGAAIVFIGGFLDDLRVTNSVGGKLLFQIPAALLFILGLDFSVLQLSGFSLFFVQFSIFCFIFFMTNAANLMDNMNGLAAGLSVVIISTVALIAATGAQDPRLTLLGILVVVSILGFGVRNFPYGKIYMGDQGSQLLGFFSTSYAITVWLRLYKTQVMTSLALGILCLVILFLLYFADVVLVVTIRLREKRSPFIGDQCHLSHQLVKRGWNPTQSALTLFGINSALAILVYYLLAS